ncbi:hypothetical protein AADZ84_14620 [Colwelliaceae bacterium MEBiC 14330]
MKEPTLDKMLQIRLSSQIRIFFITLLALTDNSLFIRLASDNNAIDQTNFTLLRIISAIVLFLGQDCKNPSNQQLVTL